MKSCPKPVADFEANLENVKSIKRFHLKNYQSDNQQKCIDCLKPRSNKNEHECQKYDCDYFYVPNYQSFSFVVLSVL